MFFFCSTLQHTRVGKDDGGIFVAVGHTVNHDTVEFACLQVFLLHIEVAVRNAIIEDTFRNFEFRALLFHGDEQLGKFLVGIRPHVVLKIERAKHDDEGDDDERPERLHQRYAGSLDGCKL